MSYHDIPPDILYPDGDDSDDDMPGVRAPEDSDETQLLFNDDGDPLCSMGCGYPVETSGDICGECACEDDGELW